MKDVEFVQATRNAGNCVDSIANNVYMGRESVLCACVLSVHIGYNIIPTDCKDSHKP